MAAFLDICRFNPTAGGLTDWTFSSAVTGHQSPALAGAVNGRVYKVRSEGADLSQWELSEGAYNSATGVFARTTVLFNSSGTGTAAGQSGAGTKINFSTVPQVAVVALKEDLVSIEEANAFTAAQQAQARSNVLAYPQQTIQNILGANGGCEVWQIGTSVAVAASVNAYCGPDRWWLGAGATQASTVSRQAGLVLGSRYAAKVQRNSGQTGVATMIFEYPLITDEVVRAQQSGLLALSFTAKAGANWSPTSGTLSVTIWQGVGTPRKRTTPYTGESAILTGTFNLTGTATQYVTIGGQLSAAATQASLTFTWTPTGTAGADDSFSIDDVRLDVVPTGTTAATFTPPVEHLDHGAYLLACRQTYRQSYVEGVAPGTVTQVGRVSFMAVATGFGENLPAYPYTPSMWTAPTATTYSPDTGASGNIRAASAAADLAGNLVTVTQDGHASFSAGQTGSQVYWYHYTADARL